MSACSGATACAIYRDKKYCKADGKRKEHGICDCRHARKPCDVESCVMESICHERSRLPEISHVEYTPEAMGYDK